MSNKNLNIQQWATVATASTPDPGYKKLFPKTGESNWYSIDDDGTEKQISLAIYPKNGLLSTSLGSGQPFGTQLDIVLGSGLTFSANAAGSSILVTGLTAGNLNSSGGATSGYILTAGSGGVFNWSPFSFPGVSGSTNSLSKFTSPTTVGNSQINDNGTNVFIGTLPSFVPSKFNVDGSASILGNVYLTDDYNTYFKYDSGFLYETNNNFKVNNTSSGMEFFRTSWNGINTFSFSILNDAIFGSRTGATSGPTATSIDMNGRLRITTTGGSGLIINSSSGISIISSLNSGLAINDGNAAENKILTALSTNGDSGWKYIGAGQGITMSGLTISVNRGLGLTVNSGLIQCDLGQGLTFSGNMLVVKTGNGLTYDAFDLAIKNGDGLKIAVNNSLYIDAQLPLIATSSGLILNYGQGLTDSSGPLTVDLGIGLQFNSNQVETKCKFFTDISPIGYSGTSSETIIKHKRINGKTVQTGDIVEIEFRIWKSGITSEWAPSLRIGTSSTVLGYTILSPSATIGTSSKPFFFQMRRSLTVHDQATSTEFLSNQSNIQPYADDIVSVNDSENYIPSYLPINWNTDQYIQVCGRMSNLGLDTITASSLQIKVWRE